VNRVLNELVQLKGFNWKFGLFVFIPRAQDWFDLFVRFTPQHTTQDPLEIADPSSDPVTGLPVAQWVEQIGMQYGKGPIPARTLQISCLCHAP